MFRDRDGNDLKIGDSVTVERSSRRRFVEGSHGTVEKFGTKLVHVRLTRARMDLDDGVVCGFEPDELRKGHHGRPRHPEGTGGEMREAMLKFRNESFDALITKAVERGVITPDQGEAMKPLYGEVL
ncbi:hypothetical protein [Amycolatopsis sp. cmx-11-12]|uniref:hypothetical protein n=1 Tax=Amycolatopsis sp. cmx-11-12 TaxID=2785795 RepID=UPI003916E9A3